MSRKNLILLIAIFGSLAAVLAGYLLAGLDAWDLRNRDATLLSAFNPTPALSPRDTTLSASPRLLSRRLIHSFILNGGGITFFEKYSGKIFSADLETKTEKILSDLVLPQLGPVLWSPDASNVVIKFINAGHSKITLKDGLMQSLDPVMQVPALSPDGKRIAYFIYQGGEGGVFVSQADGSAAKKIFSTRLKDVKLFWPQDNQILLQIQSSTNPDLSDVFFLSTSGDLKRISLSKNNLSLKHLKGNLFLMHFQVNNRPVLALYNLDDRKELTAPKPAALNSCALSIDEVTLYCGVLSSSLESSTEDLYELNLSTGDARMILLSGNPGIKIGEIYLTPAEDSLVFSNLLDSRAYILPLED